MSQGNERLSHEGFSKHTSDLFTRRDMDDGYCVLPNILLKVVDFGADVFGSLCYLQ